jgi:DNA-binding NarL/FixJ family response regulator
MEKKNHVLIAESREALRKGLCAIFAQEPDGAQVTEVATSEDLKDQLECHAFDLVVIRQSLVTDITVLPRGDFVLLVSKVRGPIFWRPPRVSSCDRRCNLLRGRS